MRRKPFLAAIRQSQRKHEPGVLIGVRNIWRLYPNWPAYLLPLVSGARVSRLRSPWRMVDYQQAAN